MILRNRAQSGLWPKPHRRWKLLAGALGGRAAGIARTSGRRTERAGVYYSDPAKARQHALRQLEAHRHVALAVLVLPRDRTSANAGGSGCQREESPKDELLPVIDADNEPVMLDGSTVLTWLDYPLDRL